MARKIKVNSKKILKELVEFDNSYIFDLFFQIFSLEGIREFAIKHNLISQDQTISMEKLLVLLGQNLLFGDKAILKEVISLNTKIVESNGFHNNSFEELQGDYKKYQIYSHKNIVASPEIIILYYYFKNNKYNKTCQQSMVYFKEEKHFLEEKRSFNKNETEDITSNFNLFIETLTEAQQFTLSSYLKENVDFTIPEVEFIDLLKKRFNADFKEDKFIIDKRLLYFFNETYNKIDNIMNKMLDSLKGFQSINKALEKNLIQTNFYLNRKDGLIEENRKLKLRNKELLKENNHLKNITLDNSSEDFRIKNILLEKDKYYLQNEIEKLYEKISILEEEEKVKGEIQENINVEVEINKEIEIPKYIDIAILGGKWNSGNKGSVEEYFWKNKCNVEFFDPDKLIRHQEKIKNKDIIIFDTSYNSHSMFYKFRDIIDYKISMSNISELKKLFSI